MYGSANAGWNVYKSNPEMNNKMGVIGKKLNLKPHIAGIRETMELVGPCDIEGHLGTVCVKNKVFNCVKDGRMYICDFARCFPPEPPTTKYK